MAQGRAAGCCGQASGMFSCLSWAQNTEELLSVRFRQLWACPHHMDLAPPSEGPELAHNGQRVPLGGLSLHLWPRVESLCHAGAASWRALPLRLLPASRMGWDMHPSLQGEGRDGLRGPSSTLSQRLRHSEGGKGRLCGWESPESLERCGESTPWGEGSGATGTEAQEELESGRHGAAGSPWEVEKTLKKKQNRFETPEKTRKLCIPWFFGG